MSQPQPVRPGRRVLIASEPRGPWVVAVAVAESSCLRARAEAESVRDKNPGMWIAVDHHCTYRKDWVIYLLLPPENACKLV